MAAMQAFLEDEAQGVSSRTAKSARAWKMAAWRPIKDAQLWSGLRWKGRD